MKKAILAASLFLVSTTLVAQVQDSVPGKVLEKINEKFPATRFLNIEYGRSSSYNYTSRFNREEPPLNNKIDRHSQLKINLNANVVKSRHWLIGTTMAYRHNTLAGNFPSGEPATPRNYDYWLAGFNTLYFSNLFGKTAIYSGSLLADGNFDGFERIKGLVSASLVLNADARSKMLVGLVSFIDPGMIFPVIPVFSYERKFHNGWSVDIALPRGLFVRKQTGARSRLSLGTEVDNMIVYLNNQPFKGRKYEYRQLEISSGLTYEHYLGNSVVGFLRTGVKNIGVARAFEKNKSIHHYIYQANPESSYYVNVGMSFNPFGKYK